MKNILGVEVGTIPERRIRPEFPKRVVLLPHQSFHDYWTRFFEAQYQDECARLGIDPEPIQTSLI